jgi:hypothetical protein
MADAVRDGLAAARRRGMDRIGKHAYAEPSGKSHGFPQWHFWSEQLVDGLIKDPLEKCVSPFPLLFARLS